MKAGILALLTFSLASFGQPVEGPYIVIESDSAIHHIHVAARNDSIADVFWQVGDTAFHAAFSFEVGAVYAGPQAFPAADSGFARTLEDAIAIDGEWRVMAYDLASEWFSSAFIAGADSVSGLLAFHSGRTWCPDNLYLCCSHYNSHFAFSSGASRSFFNWQDNWGCHWMWGWEGGIDYTLVLTDSAGFLPVAPFAYQGPFEGRAFPLSGDTAFTVGWWPWAFYACSTSTYNCFGVISEVNCQAAPVEVLPTPHGRLLALCESRHDPNWGWDVDQRFIELNFADGTCTDVLALAANPIAATSQTEYGIAWLSRPDNGLLLNRADTTGALVQPAGVVYWPEEGMRIIGSNIALSESGKIVVVWTTEEIANPGPSQLWIEAVDWETPLSMNPEPERTAVRRYELNAYPNPLNAEATLSFTLPNAGQVSLKVFDVTGRLVTTLLENERKSSGNHHIILDASGLASGIYLCQLTLGEMKSVRKVVVLK